MVNVFLSLGSNLGDCEWNLLEAVSHIKERIGRVISLSAFCYTEPWGFKSENGFVNAVVEVETNYTPVELLHLTQSIEREMGRTVKSTNQYVDRIIDVDILFYDHEIIDLPNLVIPHPLLASRLFVLNPMFEIASEFVHPILRKTIKQLHEELASR